MSRLNGKKAHTHTTAHPFRAPGTTNLIIYSDFKGAPKRRTFSFYGGPQKLFRSQNIRAIPKCISIRRPFPFSMEQLKATVPESLTLTLAGIYGHQPGIVNNSSRGQLNLENYSFSVSRDRFGCSVPRKPGHYVQTGLICFLLADLFSSSLVSQSQEPVPPTAIRSVPNLSDHAVA